MPRKDEWIKSLENEKKQYDDFLIGAKEIDELIPHIQERKKETDAKLKFVQAAPEDFLIELGEPLFTFQKHDEEQATDFVPKFPTLTSFARGFIASGTASTSAYAEMSYNLQTYNVDNNQEWVAPVNSIFASLAEEKSTKADLPSRLDKINGRLGEMFSVAVNSFEKARSEILGVDQSAIQLRDVLQHLWGGLANLARAKNPAIKDSKLELGSKRHRGFVSESITKDGLDKEKTFALLGIMAEISSELSQTNFGKNPLSTDVKKLEGLYTRWLLVIDDVASYVNQSMSS